MPMKNFIKAKSVSLWARRPKVPCGALGEPLPAVWGRWSCPFTHPGKPHLGCCAQFWLLSTRDTWSSWSWSSGASRLKEGCQATGQEALSRNWCTEISTRIWDRPWLCGWLSTETDCPERLLSLSHWRYSRITILCSKIALLQQEGWIRCPTLPPPNQIDSVIQWFFK